MYRPLLELHEAYLSLRGANGELKHDIASLTRRLAESRKAQQAAVRLRDATARELQRDRETISALEHRVRRAEQAADGARQEALVRGSEVEARVRDVDALRAELASTTRELEAMRKACEALREDHKGCEESRNTCQELLRAFKNKACAQKAELNEYSERALDAAAHLRTFAGPNSIVHSFGFDAEETHSMLKSLFHNMMAPTDVRHLIGAFRVPMNRTDSSVDKALGEASSRQTSQLCFASGDCWKFIRRGMIMHWDASFFDLMRQRTMRLMFMMRAYFDAVVEHVSCGAAPPSAMARDHLSLRPVCWRPADADAPHVIAQALHHLAMDAGTPWGGGVEMTCALEPGEDPSQIWSALIRDHGIYCFGGAASGELTYRYVHPPSELEPYAVTMMTSESAALDGGGLDTLMATFVERTDRAVMASSRGDTSYSPPSADAWDRHCRGIVLLSWQAVGRNPDVIETLRLIPEGPARDAAAVRMFSQAAASVPNVCISESVAMYRSVMVARHHAWVLNRAHFKLTGKDALVEEKGADCPSPKGEGQSGGCRRPSGSASFQTAGGSDAAGPSRTPYQVSLVDDSDAPLSGSHPEFPMPMVGMPSNEATLPFELRYQVILGRLRQPVKVATPAAQTCGIGLEYARCVRFRIFLTFSDEPEQTRFDRLADWSDALDGDSERFTLAYSRGIFMGVRIHAFCLAPKLIVLRHLNLEGCASDAVTIARFALLCMIGAHKPEFPQDSRAAKLLVSIGDQFFPVPMQSGHGFMLQIIAAVYSLIASEMLLRMYE